MSALLEEVGRALALPALPRNRKTDIWNDSKVIIGDLLIQVPPEDRKAFFRMVAERWPITTPERLQSYVHWAELIPPSERTVPASWATYRELSRLTPARRRELIRPGMTIRQAVAIQGKEFADQKADKGQDARDKADRILKLLEDPEARELVLNDVEFSERARRSIKAAARKLVKEQQAARRVIEERIRQAQADADRSYWRRHLHLVEEISQVNAIAKMHRARGEIEDPELATVLRNLGKACEEVACYVEGSSRLDTILDLEAEDDDGQLVLGSGPGDY